MSSSKNSARPSRKATTTYDLDNLPPKIARIVDAVVKHGKLTQEQIEKLRVALFLVG